MMKRPLVSVIVPSKNSQKTIDACLRSVKKQSYQNIETIVVDNNSHDRTKKIAKKYTKHVFNRGPERTAQKNFGTKKSVGKYFLFIDSDMILEKDVIKECVERTRRNKQLKALIIPQKSFGKGFWAKCRELEMELYPGIDWIEAARFIKGKVFRELRGFNEKIIAFEEFDLPQKIKSKYPNSTDRINASVSHNGQNLTMGKIFRRTYYYAKNIEGYPDHPANKKYYKKQINIYWRYKLFFSKPKHLFKKPLIGLGLLFMKFCEFIAGGMGYIAERLKIKQ